MERIKSSREIDAVFRTGTRAATPLVIVIAGQTPEARGRQGRVAFVAGKKLGGAVTRNRVKRVLREAARRAGAPWSGRDVVLIGRQDTGSATEGELDANLRSALRRAGVTRP